MYGLGGVRQGTCGLSIIRTAIHTYIYMYMCMYVCIAVLMMMDRPQVPCLCPPPTIRLTCLGQIKDMRVQCFTWWAPTRVLTLPWWLLWGSTSCTPHPLTNHSCWRLSGHLCCSRPLSWLTQIQLKGHNPALFLATRCCSMGMSKAFSASTVRPFPRAWSFRPSLTGVNVLPLGPRGSMIEPKKKKGGEKEKANKRTCCLI